MKRITNFDPTTFQRYLRCRTTIHSPSDSSDRISSTSSSSSSILGVVELAVRFLFVFFVDASASASSTTSRISRVLNTNFPLIATLFPLLRSFRTRRRSRTSLFSFRRSVRSEFDVSSVEVSRRTYRFAGDGISVDFCTIPSSSSFAFRISVSFEGELARRVVSRTERVRSGVVGSREGGGISRVERTVIGENGRIPVFRKPERIEEARKASSRAAI